MLRLLGCLLVTTVLAAQQVPAQRSLADVQQAFRSQWEQLNQDGSANRERQQQLLSRQAAELEQFLQHEAKGDDRWNGRLMLADLNMGRSDREQALKVLKEIDREQAPALLLLTAADMAAHLADTELRDSLVASALARPAALQERLAMAHLLLTSLHEVDRGEKLFADALAAAKDDEERALVRWHRADAIRDREDVDQPGKLYYEALDQLAKDLPQTYWGGVARDRSKASQFQVGSEAIAFTAKTTTGDELSLQQLRGKVVLLVFWSSQDPAAARMVAHLLQLRQAHEQDLAIVGISRDEDGKALMARCQQLGADWPEICDGRGFQSDLFLRYQVETVPTILVLDKEGKIAAMNLHTGTKDAVQELEDVVQKALGGS